MKKLGIILLVVGILVILLSISLRTLRGMTRDVKITHRDTTVEYSSTYSGGSAAESVEPLIQEKITASTSRAKSSLVRDILDYIKEIAGTFSTIVGAVVLLRRRGKIQAAS